MRRKGKLVIWPAYLDIEKSWSEGRRVSKLLALRGVKAEEIFRAAEDLSLNPSMDQNSAHSKTPWLRNGVILVNKTKKKTVLLRDLARKIRSNRASK